jgi:hypothetical protein
MLQLLIKLAIGALIFWIIFTYLLPLLTGIVYIIAVIILVVAAIIWLLSLLGINI